MISSPIKVLCTKFSIGKIFRRFTSMAGSLFGCCSFSVLDLAWKHMGSLPFSQNTSIWKLNDGKFNEVNDKGYFKHTTRLRNYTVRLCTMCLTKCQQELKHAIDDLMILLCLGCWNDLFIQNGVGKVQGRGGTAPRVTFEKTKKSTSGTYHSADAAIHTKSSFGEEEVRSLIILIMRVWLIIVSTVRFTKTKWHCLSVQMSRGCTSSHTWTA